MSKIAYVTDLHLTHGSPRIAGLVNATARLKDFGVRRLFMGGDLIGLPGSLQINEAGDHVWDVLKARPVTPGEYKVMFDYTRGLVDEVIPQVIEADPELARVAISGNADYIGYRYMAAAFAPYFTLMDDLHDSFRFTSTDMDMTVRGMAGIPLREGDEALININNPWYGGINPSKGFYIPGSHILLTHMPAHGHMDIYKEMNQGTFGIRDLVFWQSPYLHLTGHVHNAPDAAGRIFDVWQGRFHDIVSVNPGGGDLHDPSIKVAVIDINLAVELLSGRRPAYLADKMAQAIQLMTLE